MKRTLFFLLLGATASANAAAPDCTILPNLKVDADGAPNSYRVDGQGLSYTCAGVFAVVNGVVHTQDNDKKHWQQLCRQHWDEAKQTGDYSKLKIVGFLKDAAGRPIVQAQGDPLPGSAFVTKTLLGVPGTPDRAQRHYVNASEIPYLVLSADYAANHHLQPGDLALVYRPSTKKFAYGVYGDCCSLGEASVRLHQDLGSNPITVGADGTSRANRGIGDPIVLIAFTGVHTKPTLDARVWRAEIKLKGDEALKGIGGITALKACPSS